MRPNRLNIIFDESSPAEHRFAEHRFDEHARDVSAHPGRLHVQLAICFGNRAQLAVVA